MFPVNRIIQFVVILGWMFVSPWNSHVEILTPKVIVWGGGALRWWWGNERGAPMNGIVFLFKKDSQRAPSALPTWGHNEDAVPHQEQSFTRAWPSWHPHLRFLVSRTVGNTFLLLRPPSCYFAMAAQAFQDGILPCLASLSEHRMFKVSAKMSVFKAEWDHAAVSLLHSFPWLSNIPLCGWTTLCVSVLSAPVDGHLGDFYLSAVMNCAAMNIHVQVFPWTCFPFSGLYVGVEVLSHAVSPCLTFWEAAKLISKMVASFHIPTSHVWIFQLSPLSLSVFSILTP